jgi:hypothetical protein
MLAGTAHQRVANVAEGRTGVGHNALGNWRGYKALGHDGRRAAPDRFGDKIVSILPGGVECHE